MILGKNNTLAGRENIASLSLFSHSEYLSVDPRASLLHLRDKYIYINTTRERLETFQTIRFFVFKRQDGNGGKQRLAVNRGWNG